MVSERFFTDINDGTACQLTNVCLMPLVPIRRVAMSVSVGLATTEMEGALELDALVSQ